VSDEPQTQKVLIGVVALAIIAGAGYFIYRQSQPRLGNVPQINMTREELMRGAMVDGPGDSALASTSPASPDAPKAAIPGKGNGRR